MENPIDEKFLKDRYDSELARKDKLSDSVGLPVSVLIVLGGLAVTMARGFTYTHHWLTAAFVALIVVNGIAFLLTVESRACVPRKARLRAAPFVERPLQVPE